MSPEQIIFCIEALAENSPEEIGTEAWHEIQELIKDVSFEQVDKQHFFEDIYRYSND